ncbi:hypothetical protein ACWDSJ_22455 [Nocardia sp. NPDC003482]
MDVGQSTANALYQQAVSGSFAMKQDAAQNCANIFLRFADSLDAQITRHRNLRLTGGFGDFTSAKQLEAGFDKKGAEMVLALQGLQEAALRMAAAYLRAGGMVEAADDINRRAIVASQVGSA